MLDQRKKCRHSDPVSLNNTTQVCDLAISRDGELLFSGGGDGTLKVVGSDGTHYLQ